MGVLNIVLQITQPQHHNVQKYLVRTEAQVALGNDPFEITYSDLNAAEKTEHDNVIAFCEGYLPAGKTAERIAIQIHKDEHGSKERLIICYEDDGEQLLIKNYIDLTAGQKTKYNAFKTQATEKAPA